MGLISTTCRRMDVTVRVDVAVILAFREKKETTLLLNTKRGTNRWLYIKDKLKKGNLSLEVLLSLLYTGFLLPLHAGTGKTLLMRLISIQFYLRELFCHVLL